MRMPYWLLKLLPLFDYICPRCKKEVEKNSHECIHCGEQYGKPVHVPPKVLKDPKALEDYVHENVFPKVSKAQRDYLTQFFTILFSDGFESGDFSTWAGTTGTPTVSTDYAHHGTYSALINGIETVYYSIISTADARYIRAYVYFVSLPTSDYYQVGICGFAPIDFHNYPYFATVYKDPADSTVKFAIRNGYSNSWNITSIQPSTGQWYLIELKYVKSGTSEMWIDGNSEATLGCPPLNIDYSFVGSPEGTQGSAYIDCVVVADAYIGPEAEVSIPVMMHHYNMMKR